MRCFAISDLHLSFSTDKPMDRFGGHWERHWERVEENWRALVGEDDLVLLPGDHSWAMKLEEADQDLAFIAALPGHKVLSRGNHDYWWQALGKIRARHPGLTFLQNDSVRFGDLAVCGTRGWNLPPKNGFADPQDDKIFKREVERLKLSIASLPKDVRRRVAMIHYPPLLHHQRDSEFTRALEAARIDACVYGHLHTNQGHKPVEGERNGVVYHLVSCDQLGMKPRLILDA